MKKPLVTAGVALLVGLGTTLTALPAQAAPGFAFDSRISGVDRFATAAAASELIYPEDGSATDVVVVNGYATVDGLTASYLAGLTSAPILYTNVNDVPAATADELRRLGADTIWIVGGTNRVSQALEDAWRGAGTDVERIAGADRYETAALVAQVDDSYTPEQVFLASGTGTADALAAGPIAWARNYPILLTEPGALPTVTAQALAALGTTNRVVLGSSASVSDAVYTQAAGTQRLGGINRQETAALIADDAIATEEFDTQSVALVGGRDATAADALSASPVAGAAGVPLLFTDFDGGLGAQTSAYLSAKKANYTTNGVGWIFGGEPSVPAQTAATATALVQ